jgi:hypothetical protein
MVGLTKKKKIRRVLKQVDDPTVADVMTTTEEFDEDEQTPIQFANAGLLGDIQRSSVDEGYLSPESLLQQQQDIALQTEGPLAQVQSQNLNPALYPTDPSLGLAGQDYAAGLPQEDITPEVVQIGDRFTTMDEMLDGSMVVHVDPDDGTEITMMDLVAETGLPIGKLTRVVKASKAMSPKWLNDLYAKILNRIRAGKPKGSDFEKGTRTTGGGDKGGGYTAGPSGVLSPKTATRTGPSATTPGPNVRPKTGLGKPIVPIVGTAIAAGAGEGGLGVPWWMSRGAKAVGDYIDPILDEAGQVSDAVLHELSMTEEQKSAEEAYARQSQARDVELQFATKEEEIVDDAAGLLSIVDTELEGLTKGTGKLSHQPFVDKVEIQEVVDTGLNPERIYADFSQDIEGKRNRYLAALGEMYKKVAILNVIASLTNSPSQATAFMQLASAKFKALEGFDDEERYQNIAQGVFFREDGSFDAPKSKEEAFNRAIKFGATHSEAIKLSGHKAAAKTATTTGAHKTWHNPTTKQSVVMEPGQAPRGADGQILEGWFPGELDRESSGTEFERMRVDARAAIRDGDWDTAVRDIANWLLGRDSMLRFDPDEATTVAREMVKNWGAFSGMTEDEIDRYLEGITDVEQSS